MERRVIILLGPTCVGKTGVSILLAREFNTEIISADSMLVYRHMDIGTAKPDPDQLRMVKHHLIDILEPCEEFSAGRFRDMAMKIIDKLHGEGRIPLVVGGTGLYIRTLTQGIFEGPSADWQLRHYLQREEERHGRGYLYRLLLQKDPEVAKRLNKNDIRRIIRALEVCIRETKKMSDYQRYSTLPLDYDYIKIGLSRDRRELYRMIEMRVDRMIEGGLVEETQRLLKMKPGRTALQALGYKEIKLYIDGRITLNEAVRLIKKRTKMYAKRQYTWFKKEPGVVWIDITGLYDDVEILNRVRESGVLIRDPLKH